MSECVWSPKRGPKDLSHSIKMRARDMINALDRVALFRTQASDSYRRVDDIARDLDAAISLLDLQRQSPAQDRG